MSYQNNNDLKDLIQTQITQLNQTEGLQFQEKINWSYSNNEKYIYTFIMPRMGEMEFRSLTLRCSIRNWIFYRKKNDDRKKCS